MTALHYITDWNKMVYLNHQKPFRGRSLVDNMGLVMAYGNDMSFADIFAEQLKNIMPLRVLWRQIEADSATLYLGRAQ